MKADDPSITRLTTLLAGIIAVAITVLIPAGYFLISYQYMSGNLDKEAEISAQTISSLITANPVMWRFEEVRLMELLERRSRETIPETRRILSSSGEFIVERKGYLRPPVVSRRHDIFDAGSKVAQVEISRSLDKLLLESTLVAVCAFFIGSGVFIVARTIPLRAVRQVHKALKESEGRYRSLYESMKEGMALHRIIYDTKGNPLSFEVIDVNPSCESILGQKRESIVGRNGSEFFNGAIMDFFGDIVNASGTGKAQMFEVSVPEKSLYFDVSVFFPDKGLFATLFENITERKKSYEQIQQLAFYDNLTGLPNRTLFLDRFKQTLAVATRNNNSIALLFIDLDGFKDVNDNLGHAHGDMLLKKVSQRLNEYIRRSDTIARLGGDEFTILIANIGEERNAAHIAQQLLDRISSSYEISGHDVYTSASIGISIFPDDGKNVDVLMRCADMAMYAAKEAGRNQYSFFSDEMNRKAHERIEIEMSLRRALEREELFLEYQPVINACGNRLVGAEVLVRWQHPKQGTIMPDTFILVAEQCGHIIQLGEWVLRKACEKMMEWHNSGLPLTILSVNISGQQLEHRNFTDVVHAILTETGVDAHGIQFELTETSLIKNAEAAVITLHKLKKMGLGIVVDDFGTGYSSLGYLKNFPIDSIKIDRSFIMDICTKQDDRSIVEAIIAMANKLNLKVVAEGVETSEQRDFLLHLGCSEMQGFLFHRPLSEDRFVELLKDAGDARPPSPTPDQQRSAAQTIATASSTPPPLL